LSKIMVNINQTTKYHVLEESTHHIHTLCNSAGWTNEICTAD